MENAAFDIIRDGLIEALFVARGEAKPFRTHPPKGFVGTDEEFIAMMEASPKRKNRRPHF